MPLSLISLGSNIGERHWNLCLARVEINNHSEITIRKISSIYETMPIGVEAQPKFLNQVFEINTYISPLNLLRFFKMVEVKLGRQANFRWGPRKIDIDILTYGDIKINLPILTLPHPQIKARNFIHQAINEIGSKIVT